jgi:hypothetical protein
VIPGVFAGNFLLAVYKTPSVSLLFTAKNGKGYVFLNQPETVETAGAVMQYSTAFATATIA